jgi:hypothetical protein
VVEVAVGSVLVVEQSASGALCEGAQRCLVECVIEAPVADVAGEDGFLRAGCDRQLTSFLPSSFIRWTS